MKMKPYRLIYQEECFDTEMMDVRFKERIFVDESGRSTYEIREKIGKRKFEISREYSKITHKEAMDFFEEIYDFISDAVEEEKIVDDCSAYVKLEYPGLEIKASRELVNSEGNYLEGLIREFKEKHFGENEC